MIMMKITNIGPLLCARLCANAFTCYTVSRNPRHSGIDLWQFGIGENFLSLSCIEHVQLLSKHCHLIIQGN